MKQCTWKNCKNHAEYPQYDKNKKEWANLCVKHLMEFEDSIDSNDPQRMISTWIKMHGGANILAKACTEKAMPVIKRMIDFFNGYK